MAVKIGQVIDEYKILEKIGSGGNGIVYKAKSENDREIVAMKFPLSDGIVYDSHLVENFKNEIAAIMRLENPYIAQPLSIGIYKINEDQVVPYLVMEFVQGMPLSEFKNMPTRSIVILMAKVTECISYAHQKRVIHRDLKPSNIIVDVNGDPKILDFGLAKLLDQFSSSSSYFEGSPSYAAPEQFSGGQCDERTDIWTLGVILFELLTGQLPFPVENWSELSDSRVQIFAAQDKIINNKVLRPSKINLEVDSILDEICLKTMAKSPEKRYQSAEEMTARLKQWGRSNRDKEFKKAQRIFLGAQFLPEKMQHKWASKTLDHIKKSISFETTTPTIKDLINKCFNIILATKTYLLEMPLPSENLTIDSWETIHEKLKKIRDVEHTLLSPIKDIFLGLGQGEQVPHQVLLVYEEPKGKNVVLLEEKLDIESTMEVMRNIINVVNYCKNLGFNPFLPTPAQIFVNPFKITTTEWLWKENSSEVTAYDFVCLLYHIITGSSFEPDVPNWQKIPDIFRDILENTVSSDEIKNPQELVDAIEKKIQTYKILEKGVLDRHFCFPPGEYTLNQTLKIQPKGCLELTGKTTLKFSPQTGILCYGQVLFNGDWNEGAEEGSITLKATSSREGWSGIQFLGKPWENAHIIQGCNLEGARGQFEEKGAISGGAIYIEKGNFRFSQTKFSDNKVEGDGAAIHVSDKILQKVNVEIKKCFFIANHSQRHGGAISNYSLGKITIKESRFENNRCLEEGGSIYIRGIDSKRIAELTLADCSFIENRANMSGGALYLGFFAESKIKNCEYDGNTSEDNGGAIAAVGKSNYSKIEIENTKFLANRAQNRGGAIVARKNIKTYIKDSRFDGNSSIRDSGGAIAIDGKGSKNYTILELTSVVFVENRCRIDGGAINANILSKMNSENCRFEGNYTEDNSGGATVIIGGDRENLSEGKFINTIFIRNRCKLNGGAINANLYTKTIFESCRFKNNSSEDSGGAVEITGMEGEDRFSESSFKDTIFSNNRCKTSGGAINTVDYVRVNFDSCQFENNRSDEDAGAVSIKGTDVRYSEITFRKTQFLENRSRFSAGAVHLNVLTRSKFEECLFSANYAESKNGGGILISGKNAENCTEITCNKVHFIQNHCEGDGGAINLGFYSLCILSDVRFERNNSDNSGGAIGVVGRDDVAPTKITIKKAVFTENSCKVDGGAIAAGSHTQMVINDCSFHANTAEANCGAVGIVGKIGAEPSKAKFKKVSFIENNCKGDGGAIASGIRSRMIFESCNFEGNWAEGSCGAIGIAGKDNKNLSDATFTDVDFIGNHAHIDGGAIVVGKFSRIKCNKSTFLQNYAENKTGGALLILGGHPLFPTICNFQDVKFVKNYCAVDGGAINANIYSRLGFEDCFFEENSAQEKNGGAVVLLGKDSSCYTEATFKRVHFIKNQCCVSGGAINANDFTRSIFTECLFVRNRALQKNGGAVLVLGDNSQEPSDAKFTNVKFIENHSRGSGGGVNAHVYTITQFTDCHWEKNIADENGGGIFIRGLRRVPNKSKIFNCYFSENVAGNIGPDVALHAVKGVTEDSLIEENIFEIPDED